MSLTYDEIDNHLCDIFEGSKCVYLGETRLVFKFPSNRLKQQAKLVYDKSYQSAVEEGMLPTDKLEEVINRRQLVSAEEMVTLKKLKGQLEAQEILLGKTTRVKANQDRIKQAISRIRHEIFDIEFKKKSKLFMSADTKAEEEKAFFICSACVYKDDYVTPYWSSHEEATREKDLNFKDTVLAAYMNFYSGKPTPVIRELARSNMWRIRYVNSNKTSDPLFGVPAADYTTDQLNLVYWSNYYQNIYEMMPESRPSDMVIEDDDALDAYMKAYYQERTQEEAARKSKAKTSGKLQAFDAEEVIVTRSNPLYEDIDYDKPREAQKIKDRVDLKKRTKRG
jgi:hypothetical protein